MQNAFPEPPELTESLAQFRRRHPDPAKAAFIMMKFGTTKAHEGIIGAIRSGLEPFGVAGLRADDHQFHDDLYWNVATFMHGCGFGIAVFERLESDTFNPNVSLEVGYLLGLRKQVCLPKDRTMATLHSDLTGKLYRSFDNQDPAGSIPPVVGQWIKEPDVLARAAQLTSSGVAGTRMEMTSKPAAESARELIQNGVLWRDEGESYIGTGGAIAEGPLCPDDKSTLLYGERRYGHVETRPVQDKDIVNDHYGLLACPECGRLFDMDGNSPTVVQIRHKAEARFNGRRRQ